MDTKEDLENKIKELEDDNEYLHMKCEMIENDLHKRDDAAVNMAKAQLIRRLRDIVMNLTLEE